MYVRGPQAQMYFLLSHKKHTSFNLLLFGMGFLLKKQNISQIY